MGENVFEKTENFVMKTYNRYPVSFVKGEGCWLYDSEGKKYLDMLAGIAVCNLGPVSYTHLTLPTKA